MKRTPDAHNLGGLRQTPDLVQYTGCEGWHETYTGHDPARANETNPTLRVTRPQYLS
jgi:hypothetical protein